MGAQVADEAMPLSPFADGTGFCSVCLYRTRLWVPADADRPAAWLCDEEDSDRPLLRAVAPPAHRPLACRRGVGSRPCRLRPQHDARRTGSAPRDDPAPTVEQLRLAQERAAATELERRRAESETEQRALREQLARELGAQRAVEAAKAGDRWVPLGYVVRGRHERA